MSGSPQPRITPEQYLEMECAAQDRHEYFNGFVYAMAGASWPHVIITSNVVCALGNQLERRPCFVGSSNLRIRVSPEGLYTYPDVVVICGEPKLGSRDTLLNPTVIIEVLSQSTEAYDRGFKFHQYQLIESLQEYALISQAEARVEIFRRQSNKDWLWSESLGLDATCHFKSVECKLDLSAIYLKVDFDPAQATPIPPDARVSR